MQVRTHSCMTGVFRLPRALDRAHYEISTKEGKMDNSTLLGKTSAGRLWFSRGYECSTSVKGGSRCLGRGWEKRLFGKRAAAVWRASLRHERRDWPDPKRPNGGPPLPEGREKAHRLLRPPQTVTGGQATHKQRPVSNAL